MYNEFKSIVARSKAVMSCSFNEDDDMHITLSYEGGHTAFIQSLIKFSLEEAMLTGENQTFLFSSSAHRNVFQRQMYDLVCSLNIEIDERSRSILSSGAELNFILMECNKSGGILGHAYALSYFDSIAFNDFMTRWAIIKAYRSVFISIK
ncbi:hypothetical protein JI57_04625 [Psychromonas sp. PRT-SC03]|nr:hypothetical protein JI57_04625 [Psychromonas sp. PRT-SC03]